MLSSGKKSIPLVLFAFVTVLSDKTRPIKIRLLELLLYALLKDILAHTAQSAGAVEYTDCFTTDG